MFKLCFTCKNFCFDGYYCWCKKGKYPKIGFLTVNPVFFVRNQPDQRGCYYSIQQAAKLSKEMINLIKQEVVLKNKSVSSKDVKKLMMKAENKLRGNSDEKI